MPYLNYAFVTWHLYFAKSRNAKLFYPSILYEMNQKHARNIGILSTIQRSSGRNSIILTIDIAPFFPDLLSSRLRTVSGHLHSMKEKEDISRIVNILINFGLTFTQEKKLDGTYDYKLDPNIFEISIFPNCKYHRTLTYPVKQILVQELEAERLRRAANAIKNVTKCTQNKNENAIKENTTTNSKEDLVTKTCNNIISIESKEAQTKEIKYKDFFGRVITVSQDKQNKYDKETISSQTFLSKNDVWFKYKEGFSNAVRRKVIMEDLL